MWDSHSNYITDIRYYREYIFYFLASETGIRTCVLVSLVQAQAAYSPTPYPYGFFGKLLASLASFFLDDDVDGAPIRCQR